MLKIESYITPLLLSYVDRYIQNIKPEDSQVSLWGGEAVFNNLDLRLEVIEAELALPFKLTSGHIHELKIYVPWTKLASEPIVITINTIECTLKLRNGPSDADSASESSFSKKKKKTKRQEVVAPPGYVQSLVSRIVNNIVIEFNNVILKYAEEDIVLSLNAPKIVYRAADKDWKAAFSDITAPEFISRKLFTVADLTICLDKRNSLGKIEVYQEPLLYRCSLEGRLLMQYKSQASVEPFLYRIDIMCKKLDFSVSDTQLPMFVRLFNLALALNNGYFRVTEEAEDPGGEENDEVGDDEAAASQSWASWAWSYVPPLNPFASGEELPTTEEEAMLTSRNKVFNFGFYVDQITVAFKTTVRRVDGAQITSPRIRFVPHTVLTFGGCFLDSYVVGVETVAVRMGISQASAEPVNSCPCGFSCQEPSYFRTTPQESPNAYLQNSLFDSDRVDREYLANWNRRLEVETESNILSRSSFLGVDYFYSLTLPDDFHTDKLSQLESMLEYSDFPEQALCRFFLGPVDFRVTPGVLHRLQILSHALKKYEYPPFLPPPASEPRVDSDQPLVPIRQYELKFARPTVSIMVFPLHRAVNRPDAELEDFRIILKFEDIDLQHRVPMYPRRLAKYVSGCAVPDEDLRQLCYSEVAVQVGLQVTVNFRTSSLQFLGPTKLRFSSLTLLHPEFWDNQISEIQKLSVNEISMTLSIPQVLLLNHSFLYLASPDHSAEEFKTILQDALSWNQVAVVKATGLEGRVQKGVSATNYQFSIEDVTVSHHLTKLITSTGGSRIPYARCEVVIGSRSENLLRLYIAETSVTIDRNTPKLFDYKPVPIIEPIVAQSECSTNQNSTRVRLDSGRSITEAKSLGSSFFQLSADSGMFFDVRPTPKRVQFLNWFKLMSSFMFDVNISSALVIVDQFVVIKLPVFKVKTEVSPGSTIEKYSAFPLNIAVSSFGILADGEETLAPCYFRSAVTLSNSKAETDSGFESQPVSLCVHSDMDPIIISLSISKISAGISAISLVLQLADLILAIDLGGKKKRPVISGAPSEITEVSSLSGESTKISTWFQLALPKVRASLSVAEKDLTIEVDDLSASFDCQELYMKFKSKIGSCLAWEICKTRGTKAYILNMTPRSGEVAKPRSFFVFTFTLAEIESFKSKIAFEEDEMPKLDMTKEKYISEVDIQIEQFDVKLSKDVLENFQRIANILLGLKVPERITQSISPPSKTQKPLGMGINGSMLPLVYLQSCGARLHLTLPGADYDTFLLQVAEVTITPQVDNKISRNPILRPDLFEYAVKMKLLDIPGSELEDRQYKITFVGVSLSLCPSKEVSLDIIHPSEQENPALRWNKLENYGVDPESKYRPVITYMDIEMIYAPAIVHYMKSERSVESLVCGHGLEVYFVLPISIYLDMDTVSLASGILSLNSENSEANEPTSSLNLNDVVPISFYCTFRSVEVHILQEASSQLLSFLRLVEPYILLNVNQHSDKFEVAVFDSTVMIGGQMRPNEKLRWDSYALKLIETRTGCPIESTGVNPSLLSLQLLDFLHGKGTIRFHLGKPFKLYFSETVYRELLKVTSMILPNKDVSSTPEPSKPMFGILPSVRKCVLLTSQIVLDVSSSPTDRMQLVIDKSCTTLLPDAKSKAPPFSMEILSNLDFFTISVNDVLFLEPLSFNLNTSLVLNDNGTCQSAEGSVDLHKIVVQLDPGVVADLTRICRQLMDLLEFRTDRQTEKKVLEVERGETEVVTYVDDLRAGPFQFLGAEHFEGEAPSPNTILPYQVGAFESVSSLVWRYPHPRALTRVDIYPLPILEPSDSGISEGTRIVPCTLQYWCISSRRFKTYRRFSLSESKVEKLDLPSFKDRRNAAVSSIWRVVLNLNDEEDEAIVIMKPETLLCSMRVDSCYDCASLPKFEFSLNCDELSLFVNTSYTSEVRETDRCLELSVKKLSLSHTSWVDESRNEMLGHVSVNIVDHRYLTFQNVIGNFPVEATLFQKENSAATDFAVAVRGCIDVRFGQSALHALNVLLKSWNGLKIDDPVAIEVYNGTFDVLRIGQADTEESLTLSPNSSMKYAWRSQRYKPELRLSNEATKWVWSQPFDLALENFSVVLGRGTQHEVALQVMVEKKNGFCRKVVIRGQIQLASLLKDPLELSLIPSPSCLELQKIRVHLPNVRRSSTLIADIGRMQGFHLRLADRTKGGGVWSGQIPVSGPRARESVLVKIPQSEKEKFITIWCHFLREQGTDRVLILLSPLYIIRSHLPRSLIVHVKSSSLNTLDRIEVEGMGALTHLSPPGCIDTVHQLTFQIGPAYPESPTVPLSWGMLQHEKLPNEVPSLPEFLKEINSEPPWPYFDLGPVDWVDAEQPNVDVNVVFTRINPLCNTLLLEIKPWAIFVNKAAFELKLQPVELTNCWNIPTKSVLSLPKFSSTFSLFMEYEGEVLRSEPLQLIESDRKFSSFRPKMSGSIPVNGFCKVSFSANSFEVDLVLHCKRVDAILVILALDAIVVHSDIPGLLIGTEVGYNLGFYPRRGPSQFLNFQLCDAPSASVELVTNNSCGHFEDNVVFEPKRFCGVVPLCAEGGVSSLPIVVAVAEKFGVISVQVSEDKAWVMMLFNKTKETVVVVEAEQEGTAATIRPGTAVHFSPPGFVARFPETFTSPYAKRLLFACETESGRSGWSQPIELVSSYDQFVCIPHCTDLKVHLEIRNGKHIVDIEPISRLEVSASEIRKRLTKRSDSEERKEEPVPILPNPPPPENKTLRPPCKFAKLHASLRKALTNDESPNRLFVSSYIKLLNVTLLDDVTHCQPIRKEVIAVTANQLVLCLRPTNSGDVQVLFCMEGFQFDNQMYAEPSANYSWPVIFCRKDRILRNRKTMELPIEQQIAFIRKSSFIELNVTLHNNFSVRNIDVRLAEFTAMLEDTLYYRLKEIMKTFTTENDAGAETEYPFDASDLFSISSHAQPLTLDRISIQAISGTLSVHSSVKIYIALDHTPLNLAAFIRKDVLSTSYHLGQAFAMHCLSNILFKAGWMVGSLEIIGSPALLLKRYSTGLKDFIKLPYHGLFKGPRGFAAGVVHGSMSLISHITGGTLLSVTQVADNIARNLDRLTLDSEHIGLREEGLKKRPKDLTEGLAQGLSEFGLSVLGAIGGLAHHPMKSLMEGGGATGVAVGVTKGAIGLVTKPLGGAASFVASTGRGLLAGSYETEDLHALRTPLVEELSNESSSEAKIRKKLGSTLLFGEKGQFYLFEAMRLTSREFFVPLILIVTEEVIVFHNAEEDIPQAVLNLRDLECTSDENDPTMVYLKVKPKEEPPVVIGEEAVPPFDQKRILEYLSSCSGNIESSLVVDSGYESGAIRLVLNPGIRNHFVAVVEHFLSRFLSVKF